MKKTLIICAVLVLSMVMSQPAEADPLVVPLYAGQDLLVGHVTVEVIDDEGVPTLRVEYLLDVDIYEEEDVDCITGDFLEFEEIHLHVATSPGGIPVNKKGLPEIGHFMYNGNPTEIPLSAIPAVPGDTIYIAAHAVVYNESEFCGICDELVIGEIAELVIDYTELTGDSYFEITIGDETYPVWCVDFDHSMSLGIGPDAYPIDLEDVVTYAATCVPALYDPFPTDLGSGYGALGGIDRPENLPAVVWILNQWRLQTAITALWNVTDIQWAVWSLVEAAGEITPTAAQQAIIDEVPAELPEPGCCDYVGVIIMPTQPVVDLIPVPDIELRQLAILLVPAPCCMDETAWALDPVTGTLFAPDGPKGKRSGSWAEYFSFVIPGGS
jgi:hypothetical protein